MFEDLKIIDAGRTIDWSKASEDYAKFRPGPPIELFSRLAALGVGVSGQTVLDLGTGTGIWARQFARSGCDVTGVDIAEGQIAKAQELANSESLSVNFFVSAAEGTGLPSENFDVISASQCFLYFDKSKMIPEIKRLLKPEDCFVTSLFSWLPREDQIAKETETLIAKHNSVWNSGDFSGEVPAFPSWAEGYFRLKGMFYFDAEIPFTIDSWCGRMRACRGIGAELTAEEVGAFDRELRKMLQKTVPGGRFTIKHRLDAHIFETIKNV